MNIDTIDSLERVQSHLQALSYISNNLDYTGDSDISTVQEFISDALMYESETIKNALNSIKEENKRSTEI